MTLSSERLAHRARRKDYQVKPEPWRNMLIMRRRGYYNWAWASG